MKGMNMNITLPIIIMIVLFIIVIASLVQYRSRSSPTPVNDEKDVIIEPTEVTEAEITDKKNVMTDSSSFVAYIIGFDPGKEKWLKKKAEELPDIIKVIFEGDRIGILDMQNSRMIHWSSMMEHQQRSGEPVYVEIGVPSMGIVNMLIPKKFKVQSFETSEKGDLIFLLSPSAAGHLLLRSNPDFDSMNSLLQEAIKNDMELLITETRDEHEIIDVRIPFGR